MASPAGPGAARAESTAMAGRFPSTIPPGCDRRADIGICGDERGTPRRTRAAAPFASATTVGMVHIALQTRVASDRPSAIGARYLPCAISALDRAYWPGVLDTPRAGMRVSGSRTRTALADDKARIQHPDRTSYWSWNRSCTETAAMAGCRRSTIPMCAAAVPRSACAGTCEERHAGRARRRRSR